MTSPQERWQEIKDRLSHVTDKLGLPIDAGIMETVVVLNALGVHTTMSCEGHLDHGTSAPWVDIASPEPEAQISIAKLNTEVMEAQKKGEHSQQEIQAMYAEVHRIRREVKVFHLVACQRVMDYLTSFYALRTAPLDRMLILRPIGTDGRARLESQGALFQETAPEMIKQQKLQEYQQEMQTFTAFLKELYFAEHQ